jgi:hypothetical protein
MGADGPRGALFESDKHKIFESDAFLFVLDGRVPDEGACVELGLAYAHKGLSATQKRTAPTGTSITRTGFSWGFRRTPARRSWVRSSQVRQASLLQGPRRGGARPLPVPLLCERALRVRAPAGREALRAL